MNKPVIFLRTASVLTLIHAILHTIGGVFGDVAPGPASIAVAAMKANHFPAMGEMRTFWEFYRGMGLCVSLFLTAEAVVFWQLGQLAKSGARRLRPVLITFLIAYAILAANSYTYFFLAPVVTELLIAACLGVAIVTARRGVPARASMASQ
ncbi:MAG TPA: hypothetical protein VGG56_04510 [Terracidiphilus sp.]